VSELAVCRDGWLSDGVAGALEPKLQDALNHPTRREVLRVLHGNENACSMTKIFDRLSPFGRGELSYHVEVLHRAGVIFVDVTRPAVGGREVLYRSDVVGEGEVLAVLRATERQDRERRRAMEEDQPPGFLKMFRIPHPGRAIRLRGRSERKSTPSE
jgi:DNA-binding transcriptional ArsR family regulator